MPASAPTPATRALLGRLFDVLDWDALGDIYCDEGGAAFFEDRRQPIIDLGWAWAQELGQRLERGGKSVYIGAGVAELPALLFETCDLDRACAATNRRSGECELLNAALAEVGLKERLWFVPADARELLPSGPFDHASLVSVLNDPETYPWVSELAYGRASPLHLDVEAFATERDDVRALVRSVLGGLTPTALVTTTYEEVPWVLEAADELELTADAEETMVDTALVGDPIGFLTLRRA